MKTLVHFLIAVALGTTASAGEITIYNDQPFPRLIRLGHKGQKLYGSWILPGQRVVVTVDESRRGKPILLADCRETFTSPPKWSMKAYPLPKKSQPLFFNMSWFPRGH